MQELCFPLCLVCKLPIADEDTEIDPRLCCDHFILGRCVNCFQCDHLLCCDEQCTTCCPNHTCQECGAHPTEGSGSTLFDDLCGDCEMCGACEETDTGCWQRNKQGKLIPACVQQKKKSRKE